MLSKEEYIELYVKGGQAINAILEVLNNLVEVKVEIDGEEAIKIIRDFQQKYFDLINEHFELLDRIKRIIDKAKELSDSNDELERTIYSLDCELNDVYNPKPYKFEDLKPNMWVWDNVAKECLYVVRPFVGSFTGVKYFTCLGIYKNLEEIKKLDIKFEENRFFPVQCANLES